MAGLPTRRVDLVCCLVGYFDADECSREPDANLGPHLDSLLKAYNAEREAQGLDSKPRVVLLKEATDAFDQNGKKITR